MTNARKAQKIVPASTIVKGDVIFRTSPEHGDLAMHKERQRGAGK